MVYWVIYDISSDKIRLKVASKCRDYGLFPIQKSAFLGILSKNQAEMLGLEFKKLAKEEDCIFILPSCNNCFNRRIIQGEFDEDLAKQKDFIII